MATALDGLTIRESTPADVPALAANLVAGLAGYASFQPPDWAPTSVEHEAETMVRRIAAPDSWKRVALDGDDVAGQVLFEPARDLDETAHLANLFVSPAWWGTGLAVHLLGLAVTEMRRRGFAWGRLYTPEQQVRARRFYEREGWRVIGEPTFEPALGMTLVQYRLALGPPPGGDAG